MHERPKKRNNRYIFEEGKSYIVPPEWLKGTPWNPLSRTHSEDRAFLLLLDDIRENGQMAPVIITTDGVVIDGNRRKAALRALKRDVWCVVKRGELHVLYQHMNARQVPPTRGSQPLEIFMVQPLAISKIAQGKCQRMIDEMGAKNFEKFTKKGGSFTAWAYGGRLASYLGLQDHKFEVVMWCLRHKQSLVARLAVEQQAPKERIIKAFHDDVSIKSVINGTLKPTKRGSWTKGVLSPAVQP